MDHEQNWGVPKSGCHRRNWSLPAVLLTLTVAAVIVVTLWAARGSWRSYTFPFTLDNGSVITVDYPTDWILTANSDPTSTEDGTVISSVQFQRRPETGLFRLWTKYVLRRKTQPNLGSNNINIAIIKNSPETSIDADEQKAATIRSQFLTNLHIVRRNYQTGHALNFTCLFVVPRSLSGRNPIAPEQVHEVKIYSNVKRSGHTISVTADMIVPMSENRKVSAAFDEMVSRIHFAPNRVR